MSSIIHGSDLIVRKNTSSGDVVVACARSCEITKQDDMIETCSTANGSAKEYYPGRYSWQVSVTFFVTSVSIVADVGGSYDLFCNGSTLGTAYLKEARISGTVGNLSQGTLVFQGTGPYGQRQTPSS